MFGRKMLEKTPKIRFFLEKKRIYEKYHWKKGRNRAPWTNVRFKAGGIPRDLWIEGKKEAEIDLVIDRADQCINLCEIKFSNAPYEMSKSYARELQIKKETFRERTRTRKALFTTLITPYGANTNSAYLSAVDNQLVIDELF